MATQTARVPEDCDHLLGELLAVGDVGRIVELYEKGASFVNQDRQVLTGRDAIRAAFAGIAAARPRLKSNIVRTLRNGDNLAMLYNDWTMSLSSPDGQSIEMTGKAIEVVCRQADGSWCFALDDPWGRGV